MRTIKIILLLTTISFFTSVSASAEEKGCSVYKGNTQRFVCEKLGLGGVSSGTDITSDKPKKTDKPKKEGNGFFQKLKNFGGKNIGEPG